MSKILANALLLLLTAVVYGDESGIYIDIVASSSLDNSYVSVRGEISEIIPDEELATWKLNDNLLLKNMVKISSGGLPDDVYLKSPTPWGDLYKKYNWPQVERTLFPTSAKILDIIEEDTNHTEYYTNYLISHPATLYTVSPFFDKVVETVSSTWTENKELHIGPQIGYNVNMLLHDNNMHKISHMGKKLKWGQNNTESKIMSIVPSYELRRNVAPGQSVLTQITLKRTILEIEVKYTATLSGFVACNYINTFKGHHFRGVPITEIQAANRLLNIIKSTEIIRIVFYPLMHLTVKDPNPGTKNPFLFNGPLEIFKDYN